jgi:hypothetical protein
MNVLTASTLEIISLVYGLYKSMRYIDEPLRVAN